MPPPPLLPAAAATGLLLLLVAAAPGAAGGQPPQFTVYSCDTTNQPTYGGNIFSAIRIGHPKAAADGPHQMAHCPSYNSSADPLGPCFVSPEAAKAYLDKLPAGHRSISLEGQPTL